MTIRKPMAVLLALLLLLSVGGSFPAVSFADMPAVSQAYQSKLVLDGQQQEGYVSGDEIQLKLQLSGPDDSSFGVRLYDNEITVDTSRLEIVSCTAPAIDSGNYQINSEYEVNQELHTQTIKWVYISQNPGTCTGTMDLGSIRLRVKDRAVNGTAAVSQNLQGVTDQNGLEMSAGMGPDLALEVANLLPSYHVGLRITEGEKARYAEGDSLTLQAYITSSAIPFAVDMASTTVYMSDPLFAVKSAAWGTGVAGSTDQLDGSDRKLTMVYTAPGESTQNELILGTFQIQVKPGVSTSGTTLRQRNVAVTEAGGESSKVTANNLELELAMNETAVMNLTSEKTEAVQGETFEAKLSVSMTGSYAPRMASSVLLYDTEKLEVVTISALSAKAYGAEDAEHAIKWVYFDQAPANRTGALTLGSITFRVKDEAKPGAVIIGQQEYDLVVQKGETIGIVGEITAPDLMLAVLEKPLEQTSAPAITPAAVRLASEDQSSIAFSVTNGTADTVYKVYGDASGADVLSGYTAAYANGTLTLARATGALEAKDYYVSAQEPGKTESARTKITVNAYQTGVTVSGSFTSYDPKKEATITLTSDTDASKVYSVTVGAISGQGQKAADFALEGVAAGTYTLLVTKPAHLSFTVKNIVIGETDVDLRQDARAAVQNMIMICGDVQGENVAVNADDSGIIANSANFNKSTDAAAEPVSDLNGDAWINADDLGILENSFNFNKSPIVVE